MDNVDWDKLTQSDEDEINPQLKTIAALAPDDFLFDVRLINDILNGKPIKVPSVVICPEKFFQQNGYCYDQHLTWLLDAWLPNYLDEACEASFEVTGNQKVSQITNDLLAAGFKKNLLFEKFLDSCS